MDGLCLLCKETITSPIAIEQLKDHVELWIPDELRHGFNQLHSSLMSQITTWTMASASAETGEQLVCIHCYVKEVYQWVKQRDLVIATQFLNVFSFGYQRASFEKDYTHHAEDTVEDSNSEFGICDECGEYTDELEQAAGEWTCKECSPQK